MSNSRLLFRCLLRLYPREFRERFGSSMTEVFTDQLRAATSRTARARLWLELITETPAAAAREHLRPRQTQRDAFTGTHALPESAISEMARHTHYGRPLGNVASAIIGFAAAWLANAPLSLAVPLFLSHLGAPLYVALRRPNKERLRQMWRDYRVDITADRITEHHPERGERTIERQDVVALCETSGWLQVKTADERRYVILPHAILGYQQLRTQLSQWVPIQEIHPGIVSRFGVHAGGLFFAALLARDPAPGLTLIVLLTGFIAAAYRSVRLNTPQSPLTQTRILFVFVLLPLAIKAWLLYQLLPER